MAGLVVLSCVIFFYIKQCYGIPAGCQFIMQGSARSTLDCRNLLQKVTFEDIEKDVETLWLRGWFGDLHFHEHGFDMLPNLRMIVVEETTLTCQKLPHGIRLYMNKKMCPLTDEEFDIPNLHNSKEKTDDPEKSQIWSTTTKPMQAPSTPAMPNPTPAMPNPTPVMPTTLDKDQTVTTGLMISLLCLSLTVIIITFMYCLCRYFKKIRQQRTLIMLRDEEISLESFSPSVSPSVNKQD